jgi:hypothetical protein
VVSRGNLSRLGKGPLTCQREQDQPVHDEDGPEDWQVEDFEPAADEADHNGACGSVPELELGQSSDKRSELLVLFCWQ